MKRLFALILVFSAALLCAGPIEDLKPGCWYEVPGSRQESVKPGDNQFPGTNVSFFSCGMGCWAGGAYDTRRDRLIFSGGGHGSYWGNEVYAFYLSDLKWHRLNDPSMPLEAGVYGMVPVDKSVPAATHTYDGADYLPPPVDRYAYADNESNHRLFMFDQDALKWEPKVSLPANVTVTMAYDPVSGRLLYHGIFTNELVAWDPATNMAKGYGPSAYLDYNYTGAVDPKRRKFVGVGGSTWDAWGGRVTLAWDISDLSARSIPAVPLITTGDREIESSSSPGLEYDPVIDKFVAWKSGAEVYTLDMDTRVWKKIPPSPANTVVPTLPDPNGTFGRFRYVPSRNVYILANRSSDNIFIYRLSAPATAAGQRQPPPSFADQARFQPDGIYDIRGHRVSDPGRSGIYLIRVHGKITKRLVLR